MIDPWKKYAEEQRDQFDIDTPTEDVWENITNKVGFQKKTNYNWIWKAAAVLLLISSGLLSYLLWNQQATNQLPNLSNLSGPYEEMERDYQLAISQLTRQLETENYDASEYIWIFDELAHLDEINVKYREDLKEGQVNEKLIEALIDHYEKKLKLLKKLELEINRKKHETKINSI